MLLSYSHYGKLLLQNFSEKDLRFFDLNNKNLEEWCVQVEQNQL